MFAKKAKTTETFISPAEFDRYTALGYVIFMSRPTSFGTYRAIKIDLLTENEAPIREHIVQTFTSPRKFPNPFTRVKLQLSPSLK